jgi:hypothetical protein
VDAAAPVRRASLRSRLTALARPVGTWVAPREPMRTRRRRPLIALLAVAATLVCTAPVPGDAAQSLELPYWKGSLWVTVPTQVKVQCLNDIARISVCEASGCKEMRTYNCHPYGCTKDGTACAASCSTTADCAGGSECNTTTGQCSLSFGSCSDAFTIRMPNGQTASCAPYKCIAGSCQQQCSSSNDCVAGYVCKKSSSTKRYYCAKAG